MSAQGGSLGAEGVTNMGPRQRTLLNLLRTASLGVGFVLLCAYGVLRLANEDSAGFAYLGAGFLGVVFVTRRGITTAIAAAALLALVNFARM